MGLSTENVKTSGGGIAKTMQPGNAKAKLLKLTLNQPEFLKKEDGYYLLMEMVGEKPTEDFEGFLLDKDNPDGGRYEGQVGRIKSSRWPYRDGKTKTGIEISRDNEILKFVKTLCEVTGCVDWFKAVDNKYDTIEEFIEGFNADAPFKDKFIALCIAGRQYQGSNEDYLNYDLYLPKFSKAGVPLEEADKKNSKLLVFDEELHIEIPEAKEIESFDSSEESTDDAAPFDTSGTGTPEFEL